MKIALISLPWSIISRPSAALGVLGEYLRKHVTGVEVDCFYEYLNVAEEITPAVYAQISHQAYEVGEIFYSPLLYPEREGEVDFTIAEVFAGLKISCPWYLSLATGDEKEVRRKTVQIIRNSLGKHLDDLTRRTLDYEVVGLTVCFGQLLGSLAYCKQLKEQNPKVKTVLGGSTLSGPVGPSVLKEYPFVDYIIQGEGELPFSTLIQRLEQGDAVPEIKGVLTRDNMEKFSEGVPMWEVPNMDELPIPNYEEYADRAEELGITWMLPIEGSRGCWWDRTKKTSNPKSTCYFCNLNVQWNGYREKNVKRLVAEIVELTQRHGHGFLFFLDNIIRHKGVVELAEALKNTKQDLNMFYEMRANVSPYELVRLMEAGLEQVQFGVEALSTSILRRMGKGTTTIQNLQAMKSCHELGIVNMGNLIVDFPGCTPAEVEETAMNIRKFAYPFNPLMLSSFRLGVKSTVDVLAREFGIVNIRNADIYRVGLPAEVYSRLKLFDLAFDQPGPKADWSKVSEVVEWWKGLHSGLQKTMEQRHLMSYLDGNNFIRINYNHFGATRTILLKNEEVDLYRYCMQIRGIKNIRERFSGRISLSAIEDLLAEWEEEHLLFREGNQYLSMAPATSPRLAARRILAAHLEDKNQKQTTRTSDSDEADSLSVSA